VKVNMKSIGLVKEDARTRDCVLFNLAMVNNNDGDRPIIEKSLIFFSVWGGYSSPNADKNQCIQFKFEPNWFINSSVIGNSSFEPPSLSPFWPSF